MLLSPGPCRTHPLMTLLSPISLCPFGEHLRPMVKIPFGRASWFMIIRRFEDSSLQRSSEHDPLPELSYIPESTLISPSARDLASGGVSALGYYYDTHVYVWCHPHILDLNFWQPKNVGPCRPKNRHSLARTSLSL